MINYDFWGKNFTNYIGKTIQVINLIYRGRKPHVLGSQNTCNFCSSRHIGKDMIFSLVCAWGAFFLGTRYKCC